MDTSALCSWEFVVGNNGHRLIIARLCAKIRTFLRIDYLATPFQRLVFNEAYD